MDGSLPIARVFSGSLAVFFTLGVLLLGVSFSLEVVAIATGLFAAVLFFEHFTSVNQRNIGNQKNIGSWRLGCLAPILPLCGNHTLLFATLIYLLANLKYLRASRLYLFPALIVMWLGVSLVDHWRDAPQQFFHAIEWLSFFGVLQLWIDQREKRTQFFLDY